MIEGPDNHATESPLAGAPTWVRVLQAALIGLVAGLALHAILSLVVLHGQGFGEKSAAPTECRKRAPAHDAAAPATSTPAVSSPRWLPDRS